MIALWRPLLEVRISRRRGVRIKPLQLLSGLCRPSCNTCKFKEVYSRGSTSSMAIGSHGLTVFRNGHVQSPSIWYQKPVSVVVYQQPQFLAGASRVLQKIRINGNQTN